MSYRGWYWHLAGASLLAMGCAIASLGDCAKRPNHNGNKAGGRATPLFASPMALWVLKVLSLHLGILALLLM